MYALDIERLSLILVSPVHLNSLVCHFVVQNFCFTGSNLPSHLCCSGLNSAYSNILNTLRALRAYANITSMECKTLNLTFESQDSCRAPVVLSHCFSCNEASFVLAQGYCYEVLCYRYLFFMLITTPVYSMPPFNIPQFKNAI